MIGVDETFFLRASGKHPAIYATGIADLTTGRPARLRDVVPDRSGTCWREARQQDQACRDAIETASLDPFRGYLTALVDQLPRAVRLLDPFHLAEPALTRVDKVRRRVPQDTLGHRGYAGDPLFRTRRLLRRRLDRLALRQLARMPAVLGAGDPTMQVTAAWLVAQQLMAAHAHPGRTVGRNLAERAIILAKTCPVAEI